jgi:hypothetical protein
MLIRHRAYRTFPFFFAYTTFGVGAGVARLLTLTHARAYFWTYWGTDAIYIVLATLTLFEVFGSVLGEFTRLRSRLLFFSGIVAAGVFLSLARTQAIPQKIEGPTAWIVTAEIAVRFVQVLAFCALVALVPLLGIRWNRHARGIAAGFGMYATVMLWMTTRFSDLGAKFKDRFGMVSVIAYSAALMLWMWFFRKLRMQATAPINNHSGIPSHRSSGGSSPIALANK